MILAVYCLLISAAYTAIYLVSENAAEATLILFVALLLIPTVLHQTVFLKRARRRATDR